MDSSGQAEIDSTGRSGAAANTCCQTYTVVQIGVTRHRQCNVDIGKADIRVGIDIQAAY